MCKYRWQNPFARRDLRTVEVVESVDVGLKLGDVHFVGKVDEDPILDDFWGGWKGYLKLRQIVSIALPKVYRVQIHLADQLF